MSWAALLAIITEEAGPVLAARIAERAAHDLPGVRLTVGARVPLSPDAVAAMGPGRPRDVARRLGVAPSTIYRTLRRAARDVR